jgi:hypothetical protein
MLPVANKLIWTGSPGRRWLYRRSPSEKNDEAARKVDEANHAIAKAA